jgi:arginyl-tRNA synthetase
MIVYSFHPLFSCNFIYSMINLIYSLKYQPKEKKLDIFKEEIAEKLCQIIEPLEKEEIFRMLERPAESHMGDYALPCFKLSKIFKKSPGDIAIDISNKFKAGDNIEKIETVKGYLNFYISDITLIKNVLSQIYSQKKSYGELNIGQGKTVVIDFASPNIAKPVAISHLRTTTIGNALSNLYKKLGYDVVRLNYLGDWGTQFGILLAAYKKWGQEADLTENNAVEYLYGLYVRFNKILDKEENREEARACFKDLENKKEDVVNIWKKFREYSIRYFQHVYDRIGVRFDVFSGESFYYEKAQEIIDELLKKKIALESEGALIVDLEKYSLGVAILKKSDDTTIYLARDLAAAIDRYDKYKFDKMFYVVGVPQKLYFRQLFKILELAGYKWAENCEHIDFGHIIGMKTRTGNLVGLSQILDEARDRVKLKIKDEIARDEKVDKDLLSEQIGIGAVVFNDLSKKRIKDVQFDWERVLNLEGDSGPYLQNVCARISGIIEKNREISINKNIKYELLKEKPALDLVRVLKRYPEEVKAAAKYKELYLINNYLLELAKVFHSSYKVLWVKGRDKDLAEARLLLIWAVKTVMSAGLKVLGIFPVERM